MSPLRQLGHEPVTIPDFPSFRRLNGSRERNRLLIVSSVQQFDPRHDEIFVEDADSIEAHQIGRLPTRDSGVRPLTLADAVHG
jgi:hypothetical protein